MIEAKILVNRKINWTIAPQANNGAAVNGFQPLMPQTYHINQSTRPTVFHKKTSTTSAGGHATKAHRNYQWLSWVPGMVSEVPVNGIDVITGPMSGCWITLYTRAGQQCVGHVGTNMTAGHPDSVAARLAWNNFVGGAPGGAISGFNPFNDWVGAYPAPEKNDLAAKFFALVTSTGNFYSIFGFSQNGSPTTMRIAEVQPIGNTLPNPI